VAPGIELGRVSAIATRETGLPEHTLVLLAATTDSTAVLVAAGAIRPGGAVTCLGSTLVLKIIGRGPIATPQYGYSHKFGAHWLIGGASNSGRAVLRRYLDDGEIRRLSATLDPDLPTGLDYYPLPAPGERFPINDGAL